ncbi:hypothetical protein BC938DRAFT_472017 [Jimgerdemannia flammicorona]|uniref:Major facilitator superfamily (MFS) profile domain-containing protein n=1 Tax=Jimgerdemannia flammicorona TaxID=994334 RepID=A0A433Q6X6_9FUNG|nr:hypothetical protein BC938DRAFT_472017 [Jimgerdemannia flammicorona]
MALARLAIFRLQESPRYLLASRRKREAITVLRTIVRTNGSSVVIDARDLPDPSDARPLGLHSYDHAEDDEGGRGIPGRRSCHRT